MITRTNSDILESYIKKVQVKKRLASKKALLFFINETNITLDSPNKNDSGNIVLRNFISKLNRSNKSVIQKNSIKKEIIAFYEWLFKMKNPDLISWIKFSKANKNLISAKEILLWTSSLNPLDRLKLLFLFDAGLSKNEKILDLLFYSKLRKYVLITDKRKSILSLCSDFLKDFDWNFDFEKILKSSKHIKRKITLEDLRISSIAYYQEKLSEKAVLLRYGLKRLPSLKSNDKRWGKTKEEINSMIEELERGILILKNR